MNGDPLPPYGEPEHKIGDIVTHVASGQKGVIASLTSGPDEPRWTYDISTDFGILVEDVPPWLIEPFTNH